MTQIQNVLGISKSRYYSLTGQAKMDAVAKHIVYTYFDEPPNFIDKKILVFAHHKCVLDTICAALAKQVINYNSIINYN
jgi:hypothetical protein